MTESYSHTLENQAATEELAAQLADLATASDVFCLSGDLGAGKSTFARAFIRAAAHDAELDVPSPTFTLIQTYEHADGTPVYHTDLYRLESEDDVYDLGLDEERDQSIFLVEWPDRLPVDWLGSALHISFKIDNEDASRRQVTFSWNQQAWTEKLHPLMQQFDGP